MQSRGYVGFGEFADSFIGASLQLRGGMRLELISSHPATDETCHIVLE